MGSRDASGVGSIILCLWADKDGPTQAVMSGDREHSETRFLRRSQVE